MIIFDKESIEKIIYDTEKGIKVTRKNNILHRGVKGTRDNGISYIYNMHEMDEYYKCNSNLYYFLETYCELILHDFQYEWIENYIHNRFTINMCSDEMDYSRVMSAVYLWEMIYNPKDILVIPVKYDKGLKFLNILKDYYKKIPFFLKPGLLVNNNKCLRFSNGSLLSIAVGESAGIGRNFDMILLLDFAHNPKHKYIMRNWLPMVIASSESKLIIKSSPNGNNFFKKLVEYSELKKGHPDKNLFSTTKTYWWEVSNRGEDWKQSTIKRIGNKEMFKQLFDIEFS